MRRGAPADRAPAGLIAAWAALTFAMVLVAGAVGFMTARSTSDAVAKPPAAKTLELEAVPPSLLDLGGIYRRGRAGGMRAGYARGARAIAHTYRRDGIRYQRIFLQGRATGVQNALRPYRFGAAGFYLVGVRQRGRRVDASHGPLSEGLVYELCHAGRAICTSKRPGRGAR